MAVSNPRNRVVIFRLTQTEYQDLQSASAGARSMSDFARSKLLKSLEEAELNEQITQLNDKVDRITKLLERPSVTS